MYQLEPTHAHTDLVKTGTGTMRLPRLRVQKRLLKHGLGTSRRISRKTSKLGWCVAEDPVFNGRARRRPTCRTPRILSQPIEFPSTRLLCVPYSPPAPYVVLVDLLLALSKFSAVLMQIFSRDVGPTRCRCRNRALGAEIHEIHMDPSTGRILENCTRST